MTQEELNKIIENHQHWLNEDCEGWGNMRADLSNADLSNANLSNADLRFANLSNASLSNADLSNANLSNADLRFANLSNASLSNANLSNADLSNANLSNADLRFADLSNANLRYANLSNADLSNANLSNADLRFANLSNADLSNANLSNASLSNASLSNANLSNANLSNAQRNECTAFFDLQCPEEGDFIAFKKASGKIVKLRIPAEARRSSSTTRKCRAEFADVLEILNADKTKADVLEVPSIYNCEVIYRVGERVTADSWDDDRWNECSHGIHFFITFDEAVNY